MAPGVIRRKRMSLSGSPLPEGSCDKPASWAERAPRIACTSRGEKPRETCATKGPSSRSKIAASAGSSPSSLSAVVNVFWRVVCLMTRACSAAILICWFLKETGPHCSNIGKWFQLTMRGGFDR